MKWSVDLQISEVPCPRENRLAYRWAMERLADIVFGTSDSGEALSLPQDLESDEVMLAES